MAKAELGTKRVDPETGRIRHMSPAEAWAAQEAAGFEAVTVDPDPELAQLATAVVTLPIRTEIPTQQHAGSLFEQSCLVICDAVCRTVQETLGVPTSELNRRHASLP